VEGKSSGLIGDRPHYPKIRDRVSGEPDTEQGTAQSRSANLNRPSMQVDSSPRDRETQPSSSLGAASPLKGSNTPSQL